VAFPYFPPRVLSRAWLAMKRSIREETASVSENPDPLAPTSCQSASRELSPSSARRRNRPLAEFEDDAVP
jgi:hypothetical protein